MHQPKKKVTMAQRDSIQAANKARIDSTLTARANKRGYATKEEYLKKEGVDVNKKEKWTNQEGAYTDKDRKAQLKHDEETHTCKAGNKQRRCEAKQGLKNGGRITSKKK